MCLGHTFATHVLSCAQIPIIIIYLVVKIKFISQTVLECGRIL